MVAIVLSSPEEMKISSCKGNRWRLNEASQKKKEAITVVAGFNIIQFTRSMNSLGVFFD
jgi:hypothetical protein